MIMTKHKGGEKVGRGTYWDLRNGNRVDLDDAGVLPGGPDISYRKASPAVMLLAAPVVGLAYVIALPFVAIGTVLALAAKKVFSVTLGLLGSLVAFTWSPARAYLAGKRKGAKKQQEENARQEAGKEEDQPS
jgi:hypothetical protein